MNQKQFAKTGLFLIDEIKKRAEKGSPYFFSKDTMRCFSSRNSELCWKKDNNIFFVTSEKYKENPRYYTVRKSSENGNITTIGEFQEFQTLLQAQKSLKTVIDEYS